MLQGFPAGRENRRHAPSHPDRRRNGSRPPKTAEPVRPFLRLRSPGRRWRDLRVGRLPGAGPRLDARDLGARLSRRGGAGAPRDRLAPRQERPADDPAAPVHRGRRSVVLSFRASRSCFAISSSSCSMAVQRCCPTCSQCRRRRCSADPLGINAWSLVGSGQTSRRLPAPRRKARIRGDNMTGGRYRLRRGARQSGPPAVSVRPEFNAAYRRAAILARGGGSCPAGETTRMVRTSRAASPSSGGIRSWAARIRPEIPRGRSPLRGDMFGRAPSVESAHSRRPMNSDHAPRPPAPGVPSRPRFRTAGGRPGPSNPAGILAGAMGRGFRRPCRAGGCPEARCAGD